jgi:hypothetical protein
VIDSDFNLPSTPVHAICIHPEEGRRPDSRRHSGSTATPFCSTSLSADRPRERKDMIESGIPNLDCRCSNIEHTQRTHGHTHTHTHTHTHSVSVPAALGTLYGFFAHLPAHSHTHKLGPSPDSSPPPPPQARYYRRTKSTYPKSPP